MSLMVKVADGVIATVSNSSKQMLISGNPNLISPAPNLISPAPTVYEALPVIALFFVFAAVAGLGIALWRTRSGGGHSRIV